MACNIASMQSLQSECCGMYLKWRSFSTSSLSFSLCSPSSSRFSAASRTCRQIRHDNSASLI